MIYFLGNTYEIEVPKIQQDIRVHEIRNYSHESRIK